MAKPTTLKEAQTAHRAAGSNYDAAIENFYAAIVSKDYGAALTFYQEAHKAVLGVKDALNGMYRHLSELKPLKGDKLKPGGKLDNAPEGKQVDKKADAKKTSNRDPKRGRKADKIDRADEVLDRKNDRRLADTERTEAASDEPSDAGDDPDRP